ncbi:MAG: radical SAM protein [Anaerolineales bacterium]
MYDRFHRQITYIRIAVTDRCNLRCTYCMPSHGVPLKSRHRILSYESIVRIIQEATKLGISKVRLTGGEPLVRKNIDRLVKEIRSVTDVKELTLTTNGVLLDSSAEKLKRAGLDRLNISLDTLTPQKYHTLTRGGDLDRVMHGIDAAQRVGFQNTKLNMVLIPGFNDQEVEKMIEFCRKHKLVLQRINHYSLSNYSAMNQKYKTERPLSCEQCNRIRLTADGNLKPCLFSDLEFPVDLNNIAESLRKAILNKSENGKQCTSRGIWEIGG